MLEQRTTTKQPNLRKLRSPNQLCHFDQQKAVDLCIDSYLRILFLVKSTTQHDHFVGILFVWNRKKLQMIRMAVSRLAESAIGTESIRIFQHKKNSNIIEILLNVIYYFQCICWKFKATKKSSMSTSFDRRCRCFTAHKNTFDYTLI